MKNRRKILLLASVGGGVKIPLLEGDEIEVCRMDHRTIYVWKPLGDDGKLLDLPRLKKGETCERHLHKRFFKLLLKNRQIVPISSTTYRASIKEEDSNRIQSIKPIKPEPVNTHEKLKPLLRLRDWGIPPHWH